MGQNCPVIYCGDLSCHVKLSTSHDHVINQFTMLDCKVITGNHTRINLHHHKKLITGLSENRACHFYGYHRDYYSGVLYLHVSEVTVFTWRSVTRRFHLRVFDLQINCSDFTTCLKYHDNSPCNECRETSPYIKLCIIAKTSYINQRDDDTKL